MSNTLANAMIALRDLPTAKREAVRENISWRMLMGASFAEAVVAALAYAQTVG